MNRPKRIMLIDDEVDFTELLAANLEEEGYLVMQINEPAQTVKTALKFQPDICIIDLVMPQMDGGDVVNALKADPDLAAVPVIMLTALVEESPHAPDKAQMKGGLPFVSKTSDLEVIIKAIEDRVR